MTKINYRRDCRKHDTSHVNRGRLMRVEDEYKGWLGEDTWGGGKKWLKTRCHRINRRRCNTRLRNYYDDEHDGGLASDGGPSPP